MSRVGNLRRRWPAPATRGDSELLTISVAAEQSCALVVLAGEADLTVSGRLGAALTAQVIPVHASVAEAVIAAGAGDAGARDREQPPGPSPVAACWSID